MKDCFDERTGELPYDLRHVFVNAITGEDITHAFLTEPHFRRCNPDVPVRQLFVSDDESLCQQGFYDSTDVEKIYARCTRDGIDIRDLIGNGPGQYGDVSELQAMSLTELIERARATDSSVQDFMSTYAPADGEGSDEQASGAPQLPPAGVSGAPPRSSTPPAPNAP